MCTLIALHRCVPGAALVVAGNRDEFFDRPAEPPALRRGLSGATVAPRDLRAGGTWLGVNGRGVFAAVTNQRCDAPGADRRSRGLLVEDALAAASAQEAASRLAELPPGAYNPFNLLVADRTHAVVVAYREEAARFELAPGAHVIGNVDPREPSAKVARQSARVQELVARGGARDELEDGLAGLLADHEGSGPLDRTCVHAPGLGYGTRSAFLLRLADGDAEDRLLWASGAPCRTNLEDLSSLLCALGRGAGVGEGGVAARRAS